MSIKQDPQDFFVEEVLTEPALRAIGDEPGPLVVYRLTKRGLSTPQALELVCRALRLPPGAIGFAGLKDKHATTIQHIWADMRQGAAAGGRAHQGPKELAGRNWRIERLGWTDQPFAGEAIAANRFKIEVFDLSRRDCQDMDGAADLLAVHRQEHAGTQRPAWHPKVHADPQRPDGEAAPERLRVVNYFGSQRFGSARAGGGFPARRLLEDDYEGALRLILAGIARSDAAQDKAFKRLVGGNWGQWGKVLGRLGGWPYRSAVAALAGGGSFTQAFSALPYFTQQMNVEAYQSYLWNLTAAELLARTCPPDRLWEQRDPLGLMTLRFVCADSVPAELAGLDLPLLAPSTQMQEPWAGAAEDVLDREGLTLAKLRLPGLRRPFFGQSPRRLLVEAGDFRMNDPQAEGKTGRFRRTVSFLLPRGAYATVVLNAMGQ